MKSSLLFLILLSAIPAFSQMEGDSIYQRCPVAIKDTATGNNYFIERQPATVKTYRNNGNFTIVIEQKNQFFTMFFNSRKLNSKGTYQISTDPDSKRDIRAKYSFRSGESVAFIDVISGKAETQYDKTSKLWHVKCSGLIANMGSASVSYFKATADFFIR